MKKFMGKTKSSTPQVNMARLGGSNLASVPVQKLTRPPSLLSLDAYSPPPSAESYQQKTEAPMDQFPFSEDEDDFNDFVEEVPYLQSEPGYHIPSPPPLPQSKVPLKKKAYRPRQTVSQGNIGPEIEAMGKLRDPERPSKMIHQTDLVMAKRLLRKKGGRLKPLSFDRKDLFESFEINDHFPILYCKTFLMSQMSSGDIVSLNFSGVDQLTDAFFYTLLAGNISLPHLNSMICAGCVHLTDLSVKWIVKMFPDLKLVNFNGCINLTEKSFHQLWASASPPGDILMMGTNIGVDLLSPAGENLSLSWKVSGCPIVSHSGPGAKGDAPMTCHKAVILLDKKLISSVGHQLTGVSGGLDGERGVAYWPDWHVDKCTYSFNLFEVPHDESAADLVLSDGCVVLLPYPAAGVTMETIVNSLFTRMMKIACRYPDSICVITSVENSTEKNQTADISHSEVKKQLEERIQTLCKDMSDEIAKIFKWKWIINSFIFPTQIYFSQWVKQYETLDNLHFLQHPTNSGQSSLKIIRKSSSSIGQVLQEAVTRIEAAQPYYKTISKELSAILTAVKDCHVQSLKSAYSLIPENVCNNLHPQNALPHVEKGLQILHLRGILMFFGSKENSLVAGDVGYLLKGVNQLLNSTSATSSLPCLEPDMPCWSQQDLTGTLGAKGISEKEAGDLLSILENNGCLLPVCVKGQEEGAHDPKVYVCMDALPDQPPKQLARLWPTPIPESEIQVERMYTFTPEIPASLLTSYFRHCNKIAEFCVLWKRGLFVNQGPVDVFIQQDWNDNGMPVIAVCCRTYKPTGDLSPHNYTNHCLWTTLNTFTRILDFVISKYGVFAKVTVPCPTCVPSKELHLQLQADSCHQFSIVTFTSGIHCKREGPTSQPFNSVDLLGPMKPTHSLVPRHADWYLELTKSNYVHSYKCYQCNREVEKALMPGFSTARGNKGSILSTNLTDSLLPVNHSMQPGLFNEMSIMLIRGNTLTILLKLLKSDVTLKYEIATGSFTMVTGSGTDQSEQDVSWQGSEGDRVAIMVIEGKTFAELEIKCYLNGFMIWSRSVEKQCIMPQFASSKFSLGFVLQTPGIKDYWQTETELDRLNERMCLEFSQSEDTIVSARVTGNNGKSVTLITDHMSKVTLENAQTVDLRSETLHPAGYAKSKGRPLNGKTGEGAYDYTLPDGASFAPLWLFSEAQRGGCTQLQPGGTTPPTMPCLYFPTPAALVCKMNQMVPQLETVLYKNGGIDFTGSAMTLLPGNKSKDVFQWPARHLLGDLQNLQCHPLCYIRAECEDMLVLHPAKQDLTERNPYWQLHLLNATGFPMPQDFTSDHSYLPLLWAWHVLQAAQEFYKLLNQMS
ncbi:uncharacterized protein LOC135473183 [Liolophura sinensis]|uniref:uncharacterized protein LOC135473183 n=1 Tax=Liolophura sinensis TaxID=3198878 RepID=UPI0031580189